jgi:hypothetical protein
VPLCAVLQDNEEIMFNIKTLAFSATIVFGLWPFAAMIGLGALAIASSEVPVAPSARSMAAPQIDTVSLMAQARDLPVEVAPAP